MEERIFISGVGGQGAILTGKLACYSALRRDHYASFLPTYGAAQRGGAASCTVVLSDEEILSPVVEKLDTLIAFSQSGYNEGLPRLKEGGKLFVNSSQVKVDEEAVNGKYRVFSLPADKIADELGVRKVSNIVMLGAYAKNGGVIALEDAQYALEKNLSNKPELLELNKKALVDGYEYV
ncbi:MAG: 2-oxoacid:acceptor oxidoreductase family protein [Clostridiales Family XIII bacterium]|jgi:2-oxoglutarate ferredoxin oxidoreductase subunit gamma|nr:2-oxoacid:acceptor oxidoreductase family protein [Clostridiales Family XIII bacterium]